MSDETITNEIDTAPPKGTPEYNEMMAQRYDGQGSENPNDQTFEQPVEIETMPEGGLDKFYDSETGAYDWANHAKELQYRIDQQGETPPEQPQQETPETTEGGLDWDAIGADVNEKGVLSDTNRQALNASGIPDDVIDQYLDLLTVGQEFSQQRTIEYAGGEETLNGMFEWATNNLSEEEISNHNQILDSPNWRMAIDSLRVASGIDGDAATQVLSGPQLVEGEAAGVSGQAFSSKEQMIAAMSDPRYKSDPAFRNQVRLRVGRSNF